MKNTNDDFLEYDVLEADPQELADEMNKQDFLADKYPYVEALKSVPVKVGATEKKEVDDGDALVNGLIAFIQRFIFIKEPSIYLLLALWVIGTYIFEEFDFYGYLFAYSPEPQSGKSTLLDVLRLLVRRPTDILISPSPAILFRVGGRTQLLDEVDSWTNQEELRGMLNAGFRKGGSVPRVDKNGKNGFEPKFFDVYCPRALAGIGLTILTPATRDRTFMIRMERRMSNERGARFRASLAKPDAAALRAQIESWLKNHRALIKGLHDKHEFFYLEPFSERTMDIAEPLAAIMEAVYGGKERAQEALRMFLQAVGDTRSEVYVSDDLEILTDLLRAAEETDPIVGNSTELAQAIGREQHEAGRISAVLRRHGFVNKSVRIDGNDPLKRYELPKSKLAEIVERYGAPKPVVESAESKGK